MSTPLLPAAVTAATATRNGAMWVLIPPAADDEVLVVNDTAYRIFQRCDGKHSCTDIARDIADGSELAIEDLAHDVTAFVSRLRAAGLLAD